MSKSLGNKRAEKWEQKWQQKKADNMLSALFCSHL